ncbi:helix-turn-helix domain-containing protein [Streptomyces sp. NPDC056491]|uniref:helix-turn-helix domain-containing protein n=1 Tax=Streptomyces sp. NPDC056491 TaxID=3345837 RepID=UPI0036C2176F
MRHANHYTVVGNHLLQHRELSATAIGVAAHIQSLPDGAPIGVKALTARFPEGEIRIGSALRELERHGYLQRRRERLQTGRVVTRTYSYNRPEAAPDEPPLLLPPPPPPPPPPEPEPEPGPSLEPDPQPEPVAPAPVVPPVRDAEAPHPLQNCDGCDRAFRAPYPCRCRDCPPADPGADAA